MPDHVHLPILSWAPVTYVPAKGRKEKTVAVEVLVDVTVPSVSKDDVPIACRARRQSTVFQRRAFQGEIWMESASYRFSYGYREALLRGHYERDYVFGATDDWDWGGNLGVVPAGSRIVSDGREKREEQVRAAAKGLCVMDGNLWLATRAPALYVCSHRDGCATVSMTDDRDSTARGYGFGVHRNDVLVEFVMANAGSGSFRTVDWMLDVEWDGPQVTEYAEALPNARRAVSETLRAFQDSMAEAPREMISRLPELAFVRDRLREGTAGIPEAAVAIAALEDARTLTGGHHHLKHAIRLGLDAMARSRPLAETRATLEMSADIESLSALVA